MKFVLFFILFFPILVSSDDKCSNLKELKTINNFTIKENDFRDAFILYKKGNFKKSAKEVKKLMKKIEAEAKEIFQDKKCPSEKIQKFLKKYVYGDPQILFIRDDEFHFSPEIINIFEISNCRSKKDEK